MEIDQIPHKIKALHKQEGCQYSVIKEYKPIDLGREFLCAKKLSKIELGVGVLDAHGVYHAMTGRSLKSPVTHNTFARYLQKLGRVNPCHFRVGGTMIKSDGVFSIDSFLGTDFCQMTDQMAIALYNAIESYDSNLSSFEEKLSKYAEIGNASLLGTSYRNIKILDAKVFNRNINVLSSVLGSRFDKKFFVDVLER